MIIDIDLWEYEFMTLTEKKRFTLDTLACIYVEIPILIFNAIVQPELSGGVQPEDRTPAVCVAGRHLNH